MAAGKLDRLDEILLDDWQREFPLEPRPFAKIGACAGIGETEVLERYANLSRAGIIGRIGATCRPNAVGASTLAALAAPEARTDDIAAAVNAEPGINHSYLRENYWNIWFVATGPDRFHVDASLQRIAARTGLRVLDLPLIRAFNVDLGFSLRGARRSPKTRPEADKTVLRPGDRGIMHALSAGLDLVPRPFAALGEKLGRSEDDVIGRTLVLAAAGLLSRVGVIVRHRALGWQANAMVVWQVAEADIPRAGPALAEVPGVTLCYQRRRVPDIWPYSLYCMIHARRRDEAMEVLHRAKSEAGLTDIPHQVLFSTRCFKQRGALIENREAAA